MPTPPPLPARAVTIPGLNDGQTGARTGGGLRLLVGLTCVAGLVCAGLYVHQRVRANQAEAVLADQLADAERQEAHDAEQLAAAIRDRRVIVGMTRSEVRMVRGDPYITQRTQQLRQEDLDVGGVECWVWDLGSGKAAYALFNADHLVISAYDCMGRNWRAEAVRGVRGIH